MGRSRSRSANAGWDGGFASDPVEHYSRVFTRECRHQGLRHVFTDTGFVKFTHLAANVREIREGIADRSLNDTTLAGIVAGGPKVRLTPAWLRGAENRLSGLFALRANEGHSGNRWKNERMHSLGAFPSDGGDPTPERPHIPPMVWHFGKYRATGSVAEDGLFSQQALVDAGMAKYRGREERRDIMFVHCDPAAISLPHPAIKSGSDVAWSCSTLEASRRDGVIWYLALQVSMYDIWIATPPRGKISPAALMGFWDMKRKTFRGLLKECPVPIAQWWG